MLVSLSKALLLLLSCHAGLSGKTAIALVGSRVHLDVRKQLSLLFSCNIRALSHADSCISLAVLFVLSEVWKRYLRKPVIGSLKPAM